MCNVLNRFVAIANEIPHREAAQSGAAIPVQPYKDACAVAASIRGRIQNMILDGDIHYYLTKPLFMKYLMPTMEPNATPVPPAVPAATPSPPKRSPAQQRTP